MRVGAVARSTHIPAGELRARVVAIARILGSVVEQTGLVGRWPVWQGCVQPYPFLMPLPPPDATLLSPPHGRPLRRPPFLPIVRSPLPVIAEIFFFLFFSFLSLPIFANGIKRFEENCVKGGIRIGNLGYRICSSNDAVDSFLR